MSTNLPVKVARYSHINPTEKHVAAAVAWLTHLNGNAPTGNEIRLAAQCIAEQEAIAAKGRPMATKHTQNIIERLEAYERDDPADVVWEGAEIMSELVAALRYVVAVAGDSFGEAHPMAGAIREARAALAKVQS